MRPVTIRFHFGAAEAHLGFPCAFVRLSTTLVGYTLAVSSLFPTCDLHTLKLSPMAEGPAEGCTEVHLSGKKGNP